MIASAAPAWADVRRSPALLLGCWFGAGLLRPAPGTWGSVAAVPLVWGLLATGGVSTVVIFTLLVSLVGWWASEGCLKRYGGEDPSWVVIDEVAGQAIAMLAVDPHSLWQGIAALVLFRLFDITKPGPVGWADQRLAGGLGIMADDWIAGALALLVFLPLRWWLG